MEMGFQQYCDLQLPGLILDQSQFPLSTFTEVPNLGTYGCNSYSVSSSHQEASSLVPLDNNHSISSVNGSLVKEGGILLQDYGFEFPCELLNNDLIFQGKYSTEVAPFLGNWGSCYVLMAELWALFKGLKLAQRLGITKVAVKCDNLLASQCITASAVPPSPRGALHLVDAIRSLLAEDWNATVNHIWREDNFVADCLQTMWKLS
ncbi:hypothetical protein GH714_026382 [Hevea brasiliensis]|uniref:RNase H type-1 domain-containing protein n=1 Tax=Hevea brasiliensis TaxID=3981 RepID=A0A6A6LRF4_HEVBR|nr:hypothetical protein GH714_026382 [Hevea brasiliensis]